MLKTLIFLTLTLFIGVTVQSTIAAAQPIKSASAVHAEHIQVTHQRQPYLGRVATKDVPQNIITLSEKILHETGTNTLTNALSLVSGMTQQNNFGGMWDSFAVRGFTGDINVPSGFLVNGFNYGRGFGGPRDLSGVEYIEVIKGPSSALFGRGEPGGTVNMVTKKPQFKQQGSFGLQGGSYHDFRADGDYTTPVTHTLAMRLNGAFEDTDSFRNVVHLRKETISPSLIWKMNNKTSILYQFSYTRQATPFDRGIVVRNGQFNIIPVTRFLGEPADGNTKTQDISHQIQLQYDFSKNWGLLLGYGDRMTSLKGISEWPELAAARQPFLNGSSLVSRQRRSINFETEDRVARAEINGSFATFSLRHHFLIGADYDYFEFDRLLKRSRPPLLSLRPSVASMNAIDIFNPVYNSPINLPIPTTIFSNQREVAKDAGVYIQDQIDVTNSIKIRLSGRYDGYKQNIIFRSTNTNSHQHQTALSPQIGAVYEPVKTVSLYVSYNRGFRPNSGANFFGEAFRPERARAIEIGAKYSSSDKRVQGSLAVFRMTKDNILTSDPLRAGYSLAIGTAISKGIEADLQAKWPYGFRTLANISYIDAHTTSSTLDPDFGRIVSAGQPLLNIPKWNVNAFLFKDFLLSSHKTTLGVGVSYVSHRLGETGTQFFLPSYTLVRLMGSFNFTQSLVLSGQIDNLANRTWYASSYAALWVYPGSSRTFSLRARYSF